VDNHPKPLWTLDCFFSLRLVLDDSDDWIVEKPMKKVAAKGSCTQFAPLVFWVLAAYQVHEVTNEWGFDQQDLRLNHQVNSLSNRYRFLLKQGTSKSSG
jgi:hypothetical protein